MPVHMNLLEIRCTSNSPREVDYYGLAVASSHMYVGMTQKQDGGSNQCISVYTAILSLGNKC